MFNNQLVKYAIYCCVYTRLSACTFDYLNPICLI